MAADVDYSHTAAGILGTHRETMLQNQLLLRPQLGKPLKHGYSLPGAQFTYGRPCRGTDGGTAHAMSGWPTKECEQKSVGPFIQLRGRRDRRGELPDMERPPKTAPEQTNLYTMTKNRDDQGKQKSRRIPATMVFGISTRPSTPVFDLLEHKYQDRWLEERYNAEMSKLLKVQSKKKTNGKVYETRASLLRSYQNPVQQTSPLWQLPKFSRNATPALKTFRSEVSRSAAYRHHGSDCISRRGVFGHGVYDSAVN